MNARVAILGALLTGAALRVYPVWFALPYGQARPDETTALGHAVAILAGDPNPHFFHWPSLTLTGCWRDPTADCSPRPGSSRSSAATTRCAMSWK